MSPPLEIPPEIPFESGGEPAGETSAESAPMGRMSSAKHTAKRWLREAYARVLWHSGLWRVLDRLTPPRLLILASHCVDDGGGGPWPPADMRIGAAKLERILTVLGRRFQMVTVGEGVQVLEAGPERSMVALSMDDGYRDNRTLLLPLLERTGAKATIFLITRPLEERRVDWSHQWFWLVERLGSVDTTRLLMARLSDGETCERLGRILERGGEVSDRVKRTLKYEVPRADRDRALARLFAEYGGVERELCERLFLDWDDVRALAQSEHVELGGHTARHQVLARLSAGQAADEIVAGRTALGRELGEAAGRTFAYPYGRRWDFNDESVEAARGAGYRAAVTTHAGVNRSDADRFRLARWSISDSTPLHHLVAEACGGFELLRRLGVDLVE